MYRTTSNRTGDLSQQLVITDLIKRGWIVLTPSSRDSVYDFVVDMGNKNFITIQVKTLSNNMLCKFVDRSRERVALNCKVRNSLDYAQHKIDWIAGVDPISNNIHYYHYDVYSAIPTKSFSVSAYECSNFPINEEIKSNYLGKKVLDENISES